MSSRRAANKAPAAKRGTGRTAEAKLADLRQRLAEISDLNGAGAVLTWDQATYMPPGGSAVRARQGATLSRLAHEKFTDPEIGRLLDGLAAYAEALPKDSDDAALVRVTRRDRPTTSRPCARISSRRWTSAGSTPATSAPTGTSPTR
jgi:Zn-dependent M32 family carboxypeptidase